MWNVYRDGKVHVFSEKCSTCIFRPGNLMRLNPGRLKGMTEGGVNEGGGIVCHQTLSAEQNVACRGFVDARGDEVPAFTLAREMDIIEYVDPPTKEEEP